MPLTLSAASCHLDHGGSTTFLVNLARALQARPERLTVVGITERNAFAGEFSEAGVPVSLAPTRRLIYEDRLRWAYRAVAAAQPGMLLACLGSESFELLRLAPPGVVRVGVIQSHDPLPYRLAARYAGVLDVMVGVSREICTTLQGMAEFRSTRVVEIPYGIHFSPPVVRPERPHGAPLRVLYLGRLVEEQKRISRVVALVQQMEAANVLFTLAGDGPEEAAVRAALAGTKAQVLGAVSYQAVPGLLREHDALVLLSDFEGLPLSLLEAMGEGLVPVVSDLASGMAQAVPEGCGWRVPVGDVPAAAVALTRLAQEDGLRQAMSARAQAWVRAEFSAARMAERYLALGGQAEPRWPGEVTIPAPYGLPAWQYQGWPRRVRRWLKRAGAAFGRGASSPS